MANRDCLLRSDADFVVWMNNFLTVLNMNLATFGIVADKTPQQTTRAA